MNKNNESTYPVTFRDLAFLALVFVGIAFYFVLEDVEGFIARNRARIQRLRARAAVRLHMTRARFPAHERDIRG
jgi:hypothetical protein